MKKFMNLLFWLQIPLFIIPLLFFQTEFNGGFGLAAKFLYLPYFAITLLAYFLAPQKFERVLEADTTFKKIVSLFAAPAWFAFIGGVGLITIINCSFGESTSMKDELVIQRKFKTHGKNGKAYHFEYYWQSDTIAFTISKDLYDSLDTGDKWSPPNIRIGSLGIAYLAKDRSVQSQ